MSLIKRLFIRSRGHDGCHTLYHANPRLWQRGCQLLHPIRIAAIDHVVHKHLISDYDAAGRQFRRQPAGDAEAEQPLRIRRNIMRHKKRPRPTRVGRGADNSHIFIWRSCLQNFCLDAQSRQGQHGHG